MNIITTEHKLLLAILNELKSINEKLEEKPKYQDMKRPELIQLVKQLGNKPEGWTKLSNEKLIELLER